MGKTLHNRTADDQLPPEEFHRRSDAVDDTHDEPCGREWADDWDEDLPDDAGYGPADSPDGLAEFDWEDELEPVPDEGDFWMPEEEE